MSSLPYKDTKPQGAADFYFGINATFRFILRECGKQGFIRWLQEMGQDYFRPVNRQWRDGGLPAVARYWRDFFAAEPNAEVQVHESADGVTIEVKRCPAIHHLRAGKRDIVPCFCQHCHYLNQARAECAGLSMTVEGGNGQCTHRYAPAGSLQQDFAKIKEAGI